MPDQIGNGTVPEITVPGAFPLISTTRFGPRAIRTWRSRAPASQSHDLQPGVDKQDIARDPAPECASQKDGSVGDLGRIGVTPQGRALRNCFQHAGKILNSPRG